MGEGGSSHPTNPPAKKLGNRPGRPSIFSKEALFGVFKALQAGKCVSEYCKQPNAPSESTFYRWIANHPEFWQDYARARAALCNQLVDSTIPIADEAAPDAVDKARLRIQTRMHYAEVCAPKVYGKPDTSPIGLSILVLPQSTEAEIDRALASARGIVAADVTKLKQPAKHEAKP